MTAAEIKVMSLQTNQSKPVCLPGAGVRSSARGKGHEEGGSAYSKAG